MELVLSDGRKVTIEDCKRTEMIDSLITMINGLDTTDMKLKDFHKKLITKFINTPELVCIETEFPVIKELIGQLSIGKPKKVGRPTDNKKDDYIKARVPKEYKDKLKNFCKDNNIDNLSTLIIKALDKYMDDLTKEKESDIDSLQSFFECASLEKVTEKLKDAGVEFIDNKEDIGNGKE